MKLFNWLGRLLGWLEGIEFVVFAVAAGLLLVGGPLFISYRFALAHRYQVALLTAALWLGCVMACVRDLRRRQLSWISGGLLLLWLATTLVLGFIVT